MAGHQGTAERDESGHWAQRLGELAEAGRVPGATLGIWAGGRETLAACGVLSMTTQVPVTTDAVFQIGSITKLWTATMIMQLAEEGRLSLDTTVAQVLPGARITTADVGAQITIGHLLTHTSGIDGDLFTDTGRGDDCLERYVATLAEASQVFAPGQAYSYSNSGFVLLGRIIEVLDGRSWDVSLRERLIGSLGLSQTVTLPEEAILHRAAVGHRGPPAEDQPVSVWGLPRSIGPAGLITASAADVLAFARMHLAGGTAADGTRVLGAGSVAAMQEQRVTVPGDFGRGGALGVTWRLFQCGDREVIGHDGGTVGQLAYLRVDPQAQVAACLLTNSSRADGVYLKLFSEIFGEYAGVTMPSNPGPAALPDGTRTGAAELGRHAGRYERTSRRFEVSVRDGQLHVLVTVRPAPCRGSTCAEDGPADLGVPLAGVGGVVRAADVVLAQWAVHADLVGGGVVAEPAVADVGVGQRAAVTDHGQLGGGHGDRGHPADGPDLALDRDVHDRLAAVVLEDLAGVQAAAGAGGVQALGADAGVQFAECTLPPGQDVGPVHDLLDADGGGGRHAAVHDLAGRVRLVEQVPQ
jgi:CubicO group peptidase (beta-lactamase class C family)